MISFLIKLYSIIYIIIIIILTQEIDARLLRFERQCGGCASRNNTVGVVTECE